MTAQGKKEASGKTAKQADEVTEEKEEMRESIPDVPKRTETEQEVKEKIGNYRRSKVRTTNLAFLFPVLKDFG